LAAGEAVQYVTFVNPVHAGPQTDLQRLREHFRNHNVLRVGSLARRLVWNTPALAHLRLLLHSAVRPSTAIQTLALHLHREMRMFAARKQLPSTAFVGLQLPLGTGWKEFCRQEQLATLGDNGDGLESAFAHGSRIPGSTATTHAERDGADSDQERCNMGAEAVTQVLEERQVGDLSRLLYVAGAVNISHLQQLHRQRFVVMSRARFTIDVHPDLAPAVDMELCRQSALFLGNMYSSFSFILREARLAMGVAERAMYYNLDMEETQGDLSREEALRWDVLPLLRHPSQAKHSPLSPSNVLMNG